MKNVDHPDNLTAAEIDSHVHICIHGRGNFRNSPTLKSYIKQKIDTPSITHILLDMRHCQGMDSTFMGVLAGLACIAKNRPQLSFQLTHLSAKNEALLITLGVNRVLDYHLATDASDPLPNTTPQLELPIQTDTQDTAQTSLEAHQQLADLTPQNKIEFKSVIELLQADLDQLNGA